MVSSAIVLEPIGVVHSPIVTAAQMPREGVAATIEVLPAYAEGLAGLPEGKYLWVLGWLHLARRDTLRVRPWFLDQPEAEDLGVFVTRAPGRPNPIAVTLARVLRREDNILHIEALDLVDGTPILDIKEGSRAIDFLFSTPTIADLALPTRAQEHVVVGRMVSEAEHFHGELCRGVAMGVRILQEVMMRWGIAPRHPELRVALGSDGCVADAVQGLMGATFGNRRLAAASDERFRFRHREEELTFTIHDVAALTVSEVLSVPRERLFRAYAAVAA
ncbi:MAG: tRNA (N6-threonylcarbamoyladenosine(37)-N6)-methyltransferase TrmO [Chloroflexi bacterium]|nr:tRNA (N6-threonylcarbamoyladenosine(37)-N6)-methyltransferase TrmO [Chloroflexota bacterium]